MSKYARFIQCGEVQRTSDLVDTAAYKNPRPSWFTTDEALLEKLFSPELVAQWKAEGTWFVGVPDSVHDGAVFTGADYADPSAYLNPDGSNGNGEFPPPPQV